MNKSIRKVLIAIAATIFTSTAFAAKWLQLGENLYVDTQSIQRAGPIISAWIRANYYISRAKGAQSYISFLNVHCSNRQISIRTSVSYELPDAQGKVLYVEDVQEPYMPIVPESNGEHLYGFLCNK